MKIAFYYNDEHLPILDYSEPNNGNPGVGGTQYCFLLLISNLKKLKPEYELVVYCYKKSSYPEGVNICIINNFDEALSSSVQHRNDYFLMKQETSHHINELIKYSRQKVIFWGHNFYLSDLADSIVKNKQIVANVFVGKQQYDRYIDHPIMKKSTVIHNMLTDNIDVSERCYSEPIVVYMGVLVPSKGFLELAKMWKSILKEVPSAKLWVVGRGNVYNRTSKLGKLGIADESFEKSFIPYLSDSNGNLLDSISFLGLMGPEKIDILKRASVGVVNPSARTEIFSMTIMEMASAQLPVVTLNANGFPDSIENGKTGYLCSTQSRISKKIIRLLKDKDLCAQLGYAAKLRLQMFSPKEIIPQWVNLFNRLDMNIEQQPYLEPTSCFLNNGKFVRIINRFLRLQLGLRFFPPIITIETFFYRKFLKK